MTMSAANMREAAIIAERSGRLEEAARLFEHAGAQHPRDAALLNSAGSFHARHQQHATALDYFNHALGVQPRHPEAMLNRAITLSALGRNPEALVAVRTIEALLANEARYWSARAAIERSMGDLSAAAASYDRCLTIDPRHARALHGRARAALERGEDGIVGRYRQALAQSPGDAELWLGQAQAMEVEGDLPGALSVMRVLVDKVPNWIAALELLAQQRWANGERAAFCDHYVDAARRHPDNPDIVRSWCRMLAGVDRFADAADVAARARVRFPAIEDLALIEAAQAGEGGDDERAAAIFATLRLATDERRLYEARHLLRRHHPDRAELLLEQVLRNEPDNIGAWALRDICWRMLNDPRHHWLHRQSGLVGTQSLDLQTDDLAHIIRVLDNLHNCSSWPVGQSVRDGTQTRGGLFDRAEPEIADLVERVHRVLARHRASLPPADATHPLLRYRDREWHVAGSWSVRLTGAGRHTEHIHPLGLLSSAVHLIIPPRNEVDPIAGALELGRPPPDLRLDLPPVATIQPIAGHCVLFPSTLYHGTRRFEEGRRLSVAFDVVYK